MSFMRSFSGLFSSASKEECHHEAIPSYLLPICEALQGSAVNFKNFSKIRWDTVENRCSPMMRSLEDVLEEYVGLSVAWEDIASILNVYSVRGRFQHKKFLRDVVSGVIQTSKVKENDEKSTTHSSSPTMLPPITVKKMVKSFGLYNNIGCNAGVVENEAKREKMEAAMRHKNFQSQHRQSMSAINRDAVVEKLLAAMNAYNALRLQINVMSFRSIPDMNEAAFARLDTLCVSYYFVIFKCLIDREMKRVLDLTLDKQEAHVLFDMFDCDGIDLYLFVST